MSGVLRPRGRMAGMRLSCKQSTVPRLCRLCCASGLSLKVIEITMRLDVGNGPVKFAFWKPHEKGTGGLSLEKVNQ